MSEVSNKRFVHFDGTKQEFIDGGYPDRYQESIVFINGDGNESNNTIYTHGEYYGQGVIVEGDASNSAVLKKGSNKTISNYSVSLGRYNTSGLTGWYYGSIYKKSDTQLYVYLQKTQKLLPLYDEQLKTTEQTPDVTLPNVYDILGEGSVISLINDTKYDNRFKLVGGGNGYVILDTVEGNIPFTVIKHELLNDPEDYSIYCIEQPDKGMFDMGQGSLSIGYNNKATNGKAVSVGYANHSYGKFSFTEGRENKAGYAAHAEGRETIASGEQSHSEGKYTKASGKNSHAEGIGIYNKDNSIIYTSAAGDGSHAEGYATNANGKYSHAEGLKTTVMGDGSHAEGQETQATGIVSHAEGIYSISGVSANAPKSYVTTDAGWFSHAEGNGTWAKGNSSHTEGLKTYTQGIASHAEGAGSRVGDERDITKLVPINAVDANFASHAEGQNTTAVGNSSHAEGYGTISVSFGSHSEGGWTTARGNYSHAEGRNTIANADYSHAEGYGSKAYGIGSHSSGNNSEAHGNYSLASGNKCITNEGANYSCSLGNNTVTTNPGEISLGRYNISDENTILSVGTGLAGTDKLPDKNRKNALEIRKDDILFYAKTITDSNGNNVDGYIKISDLIDTFKPNIYDRAGNVLEKKNILVVNDSSECYNDSGFCYLYFENDLNEEFYFLDCQFGEMPSIMNIEFPICRSLQFLFCSGGYDYLYTTQNFTIPVTGLYSNIINPSTKITIFDNGLIYSTDPINMHIEKINLPDIGVLDVIEVKFENNQIIDISQQWVRAEYIMNLEDELFSVSYYDDSSDLELFGIIQKYDKIENGKITYMEIPIRSTLSSESTGQDIYPYDLYVWIRYTENSDEHDYYVDIGFIGLVSKYNKNRSGTIKIGKGMHV